MKGGVGAGVRSLFLPRIGEKVLEVTANLTDSNRICSRSGTGIQESLEYHNYAAHSSTLLMFVFFFFLRPHLYGKMSSLDGSFTLESNIADS